AAWAVAGGLKFLLNSWKAGKPAFGLIGYGGMPSNHSAIVCSMAMLIALREGIDHPAFGAGLTLAFVVMMDAVSLRRNIARHARALNRLQQLRPADPGALRERLGHSRIEVLGGMTTGISVALIVYALTTAS